ncbi:temperature dependent protein affecting M2 dsRNA replication-domain-containing protein [Dipodascopsis uninucleata]
MAVKSLDVFVGERRLVKSLPLSALKDATIGIDSEFLLSQLLSAPGKKEPLLLALGGLPFSLEASLENFLSAIKSAGAKCLFVFKGIQTYKSDDPFSPSLEIRDQKRNEAWEAYGKAKGEKTVNIFNEIETIPVSEVTRYVMKILYENGVDFMVAPYCPSAQLVYLLKHENQFIDAIYGTQETLMYDIDRLITNVDVNTLNFSFLNKTAILSELGGLNNEQFMDVCILSGINGSPTFPLVDQGLHNGSLTIRTSRDLVKNYTSGYGAVMSYADHALIKNSKYVDVYKRTHSAVKYHVIMAANGRVEPIVTDNAPSDVHEFISQRLPEEIYFYMSAGIIGSETLNTLTSGRIVENVPLDGGDSAEYHKYLRDLEGIRSQTLSLLTQPLHRFYQAKRVYAVYWFDRNNEHDLVHRLTPTLYETVSTWNTPMSVLKDKLTVSENHVDLYFIITSLTDKTFAESTVAKKKADAPLKSFDEIFFNVYGRFLQLRTFVTPEHKLTSWGSALAAALTAADKEDNFAEALIAGLELIRFKVLTYKPYNPSYTGSPTRGKDFEKAHILLISRVACLLPINHNAVGFSGPLSRNLLSFSTFVARYMQSARSMLEMVLFSLLANGDADRLAQKDWHKFGINLPFIAPPNAGLGIAVKTYLDELCGKSEPTDKTERSKMKDALKKMFAHTVDVIADLEKAFRLWDAVVEAVKVAQRDGVMTATEAEAFTDAQEWLKDRR